MPHDPARLIDAYLDGTLSPEEARLLNEWVKQSPENARQFAKAGWLHRQVYDRLHVQDLQQIHEAAGDEEEVDHGDVLAQLLAMEQSASDSGMVDLTEEMKRRAFVERQKKARLAAARRGVKAHHNPEIARDIVIPKLLVYGLAAMVLLGLLVAVYAGWLTGQRNATSPQTARQDSTQHTDTLPPVVAELVRGEGLVWADRSLSTQPGTLLRKGGLVLTRGIAEVRFQSGAVATFRAPAVIELRGDNKMALIEGTMVANVPEQAYGFTVDTPTMRIVDFGTEFGITADAKGDSAVQVFIGEVTAATFDTQGQLGHAESFTSRSGLAVDARTRTAESIEVDGRAFDDLAPHLALLFHNLVVNGDFEQGQPARVMGEEQPDVQDVNIPGWEDDTLATVVSYHEAALHNYPDPTRHAMPDDRGRNYFVGMAAGSTRQRIDVSDLAILIDARSIQFDLSAWLGGFEEQDEYIVLRARFLDANGRPVGRAATLDPVRVNDRRAASAFLLRDTSGAVPAGTRQIEIEMENVGYHAPPFVRDGYADNVALELRVE